MGALRRLAGAGLLLAGGAAWIATLVLPFAGWAIGVTILATLALAAVADGLLTFGRWTAGAPRFDTPGGYVRALLGRPAPDGA